LKSKAGHKSHAQDPKPGELTMGRVKVVGTRLEARTHQCRKTGGWPVVRGEKPIEPGDSWFSSKCL